MVVCFIYFLPLCVKEQDANLQKYNYVYFNMSENMNKKINQQKINSVLSLLFKYLYVVILLIPVPFDSVLEPNDEAPS